MDECPRCGREAKDALSSNYFWVYVCNDCGELFCLGPNDQKGQELCPKCESEDISENEKISAEGGSHGDDGDAPADEDD